jgi:hypothetical protein
MYVDRRRVSIARLACGSADNSERLPLRLFDRLSYLHTMSSAARYRGLCTARDQRANESSAGLWGLKTEAEAQGAPASDVEEETESYTPQEVQEDLGGRHDRHHIEGGVGGRRSRGREVELTIVIKK